MDSQRYLTEREVSELTNLSLSTLRAHRFRNVGIPYIKIGKSVRYQAEDISLFMKQNKINTGGIHNG